MSKNNEESIIEVKDLSKSFGDHEVLRKIDFEVKKGEVICILGSSGSGKSTLLRCVNKLETQTSGQVLYHGKEIRNVQKEINEFRSRVGMVFQSFNLFNNMTVLENCMEGARKVLHVSKEEAFDRAIKHLKEVGMAPYINARPEQLSGGQKQRVAIARALATNPKILLCDEATSALDPTTTKAILALLKEINQKYGITIVIITHEMAVVQEIGTHVAIIDHGELAESGTVEEVFTHPKSKAARKLVLMDDNNHYDEMKGQHCIRIVFKSNSSFEPVIANMVLAHRMPVNILLADTKDINGVAHGQMILQLPEDTAVAQKMIQYLKDRNLEVEELDHYVG